MKKKFLLIAFSISNFVFSQCKINGEENLTRGTTATYTVDEIKAQCTECHQWSFSPNNFKFDDNQKRSTINIIPQEVGPAEIKIEVFTSEGLKTCTKSVMVRDYVETNDTSVNNNVNCNINTTSFEEIRIDPKTFLLYPNVRTLNQKYTWEIVYSNNSKETIEDVAPMIKEKDNLKIIMISLKMMTSTCKKTLTKNYTESVMGKIN